MNHPDFKLLFLKTTYCLLLFLTLLYFLLKYGAQNQEPHGTPILKIQRGVLQTTHMQLQPVQVNNEETLSDTDRNKSHFLDSQLPIIRTDPSGAPISHTNNPESQEGHLSNIDTRNPIYTPPLPGKQFNEICDPGVSFDCKNTLYCRKGSSLFRTNRYRCKHHKFIKDGGQCDILQGLLCNKGSRCSNFNKRCEKINNNIVAASMPKPRYV